MKLYLTDFNSNGTNNLFIVDEGGMVQGCIEEACFGYSVQCGVDWSVCTPEGFIDSTSNYTDKELNDYCLGCCEQVAWSTVIDKLACTPFDPNGERKLAEIKEALRAQFLAS